MKVNFMLIGGQKCGTTTLFDILNSHPLIVGCSVKEPNFFSKSNNWKQKETLYHTLFKKQTDAIFFEASTSYTAYPLNNLHISDDIFEYNSDMKFIYIVRNPIERIVSSYMHTFLRGYTNLCIEDALVKSRLYIDMTRYYTQIYPYIRKFGRNSVLIIDFDDLFSNTIEAIKNISEFLCIDFKKFPDNVYKIHSNISIGSRRKHYKFDSPSFILKVIKDHFPSFWNKITDNSKRSFKEKPELKHEQKEMIINLLRLEIIEMQKLMNKDLSKWMLVENQGERINSGI